MIKDLLDYKKKYKKENTCLVVALTLGAIFICGAITIGILVWYMLDLISG